MFERTLGSIVNSSGVNFKVWAPRAKKVELVIDQVYTKIPLQKKGSYFAAFVKGLKPGLLYRYQLDKGKELPDPCSLFQPQGSLGPSMIVDHRAFRWQDSGWRGIKKGKQVIYEMHIGAFTAAGTFGQALKKLPELRWLGVTALEIMPIADAAGRWGWGYDGVNLFAPNHNYGNYDSFKYFVDRAHSLGLAVILDVVYNHLGPTGNFFPNFSPYYFNKIKGDWGYLLNFSGKNSGPVRDFFIQNACYWINDFHLDGLRFDSCDTILDKSEMHIVAEITQRCRKLVKKKNLLFVGENNLQQVVMIKPVIEKGYGIDSAVADDFHHIAHVATTGFPDGYMTDFSGSSQEFISALKNGYLFQGQYSKWTNKPLGDPVGELPAESFVFFLQNHDQIANSITGRRIHEFCPEALYRALAGLLLLSPENVLLFMGQEFASSSKFNYFTDQDSLFRKSVINGRRQLISQFKTFRKELRAIPDPYDERSFLASKLRHEEKKKNKQMLNFHRDLVRIRKKDPVIAGQTRQGLEGAVINDRVFFLRYQENLKQGVRLLFVNTGPTKYVYAPQSLPLVAHPKASRWELTWRSDAKKYGGREEPVTYDKKWTVPGYSVLLFSA